MKRLKAAMGLSPGFPWARLPGIFAGGVLLGFLYAGVGITDSLLLDHPLKFVKKQRTGVIFPHEDHMGELDCLACHHRFQEGENVLDEEELYEGNPEILCMSCHDDQQGMDLATAFHRQCIGCHTQEKQGPVLCAKCHVSQN